MRIRDGKNSDPGSGKEKYGSGIYIPDPQHCHKLTRQSSTLVPARPAPRRASLCRAFPPGRGGGKSGRFRFRPRPAQPAPPGPPARRRCGPGPVATMCMRIRSEMKYSCRIRNRNSRQSRIRIRKKSFRTHSSTAQMEGSVTD
jgi:hypothetical protein